MSSPLYEKLFALEKTQSNAFNEYYLSIQRAALEFAETVHLLTGLPEKTFKADGESKHWVELYEYRFGGKLDEKPWYELNSFERGKLSFGIGLALSASLNSYPKSYYSKSYTLHSAGGKMVLIDLADERKVYYIDTEAGFNKAAEQFIKEIEERLLATPEETFFNS